MKNIIVVIEEAHTVLDRASRQVVATDGIIIFKNKKYNWYYTPEEGLISRKLRDKLTEKEYNKLNNKVAKLSRIALKKIILRKKVTI